MLMLTRQVGDKIQIGDDITVRVDRISGASVKLSIDAPRAVSIVRTELLDPGDEG